MLDYSGKPKFNRERQLRIERLSDNKLDAFEKKYISTDEVEDGIFDGLAKVYLKGEALKKGISEMAPAGFIPVEDSSKVIASIQRISPNEESYNIITFGQFKEACDWLASRVSSFDEDYLLEFNVVDPDLGDKVSKKHYQNITTSGGDWITEFLVAASPLAGLMLAGFMADIFGMSIPRTTFESNSSGNEPKQWYAFGMPAGVALLIELGVTYAASQLLFKTSKIPQTEVEAQFAALANSPSKRKELLETAGYDYNALTNNQKYNDYKAIKDYALQYISKHPESAQYDHWIAYLEVTENQELIKHSLAMAPTFSHKWRKIADDIQEEDEYIFTTDENNKSIKDSVIDGTKAFLSIGLRNYLDFVVTSSTQNYNELATSLYYYLDDRNLCCLIYLFGPMDTDTLKVISKILKLGIFKLNMDIGHLMAGLIDSAVMSMLSLLSSYSNMILDKMVSKIYSALIQLSASDIDLMIGRCPIINITFTIFDEVLKLFTEMLGKLVKSLNLIIEHMSIKERQSASLFVDRKTAVTLSNLIDVIIERLDSVKTICNFDDSSVSSKVLNDEAAEAAVGFIITELPNLYPTLKLPEDVRRKHFSNVGSFNTSTLKVEVPGFDSAGTHETANLQGTAAEDCSKNSPLLETTLLGEKLANSFKNNI